MEVDLHISRLIKILAETGIFKKRIFCLYNIILTLISHFLCFGCLGKMYIIF